MLLKSYKTVLLIGLGLLTVAPVKAVMPWVNPAVYAPKENNKSWFNFWPVTIVKKYIEERNKKLATESNERCAQDIGSLAEEFKKRYDKKVAKRVKKSDEILFSEVQKPGISSFFQNSRLEVLEFEASDKAYFPKNIPLLSNSVGVFNTSFVRLMLNDQYNREYKPTLKGEPGSIIPASIHHYSYYSPPCYAFISTYLWKHDELSFIFYDRTNFLRQDKKEIFAKLHRKNIVSSTRDRIIAWKVLKEFDYNIQQPILQLGEPSHCTSPFKSRSRVDIIEAEDRFS